MATMYENFNWDKFDYVPGDSSSGPRQDNADPGPSSGVLFREIHKNAWLRKLCPEKKLGAYPKVILIDCIFYI